MKLTERFSDKLGYYINVTLRPRLPKPDPAKKILACVGDSLTYGAGVRLTRALHSYPAWLGKMLGRDWQVLNYGLSWRTLQNTGDLPYRKDPFYPESLRCNARCYCLMLGSNDAKPFNWDEDNYRKELTDFVRTYQDLPQHPAVLLLQPTCAFPDFRGRDPFGIRIDLIGGAVHEIIAEVGRETNCPVVDLYHLTKDHKEWFFDGAHPNKKGNYEIAKKIRRYLSREPFRSLS